MGDSTHRTGAAAGSNARRIRMLAAVLLVVAAVAVLVIRANRGGMVYYVTVTELLSESQEVKREGVRVTGQVVPGTIRKDPLELRFQITDGENSVPVHYRGVVPDTFGEDGEVVVEGAFTRAGLFEATYLLNKCPSKYEEAAPEGAAGHPEAIPRSPGGGG